jgi:hypothetical protein
VASDAEVYSVALYRVSLIGVRETGPDRTPLSSVMTT